MIKITAFLLWIWICPVAVTQAGALEDYPDVAPTPPLVLMDLGNNRHQLEDYRGQVVLVNFWASWCTPCLVEMPGIQRLKESLADRPFTVLAVNFREAKEKVWRFRNLLKVDFPLLLDVDGKTAEDWQVAVYPTSYLLDRQGRIRHVAYGQLQWDDREIVQTIEALLTEPETGITVRSDLLPASGVAATAE
jgi:thiol-disulfide isomerase/thioredoxin